MYMLTNHLMKIYIFFKTLMSCSEGASYDLSCGLVDSLPGLVAMSKDVESLYASVKALSCVIKTSKTGGCDGWAGLGERGQRRHGWGGMTGREARGCWVQLCDETSGEGGRGEVQCVGVRDCVFSSGQIPGQKG